LGSPALVLWNYVTEAGQASYRVLETVETLAAGIRFVASHHGGPLFGRHGAGPRIGQQIEEDIAGADLEQVVAGPFEELLALLQSGPAQRLDALDSERLNDGAHTLSLAVRRVLSRRGRRNLFAI